ncbi:GATA zinc finger domain-containing protein 1-like [Macrosteles quadrilineatus]|uniref:GATA zinc finger domain-containing protein 1-like n=1 Tax=Macrosteles quadrilineatus TaxID=74068 RepID=UPI0023E1F9B6|nr:GATA zinc finger domain-containing protein 1-like [Macrosteles quadrilineatus]XP_054291008.1 GATA zinc finger domain-containing protein 1-like [Macrosteles quadrilineatus]
MPLLGEKVHCYKCTKNESFMWHQTPKGVQCNDCHESEHTAKVVEEEEKKPATIEKPKTASKRNSTRASRCYKTRQNPNATPKQYSTKGKGRRSVFKKKDPVKLTPSGATYTTSTMVLYKQTVWRSGDIVSVRDVEGGIYYAQLDLFLSDMYCEPSASITWLLPTRNDSPFKDKGFDPMSYVLGPHDDSPRKLEYFEFVMHCPSDYYRTKTPFPDGLPDFNRPSVWGRMNAIEKVQKK